MPLKKINTGDRDLELIQSNVEAALKPSDMSPFVGGVWLTSLSLTSGQDNLIEHGLARTPLVIVAAVPNVEASIWSPVSNSLSGSNADRVFINLRASASCVVNVWVN